MKIIHRSRLAALVAGAGLALAPLAVAAPASAAVYTSSGLRCTIVGTAGADVLRGTNGNDVICGLGGNDTIYGNGGQDVVDGGYGNDRIDGGAGADTLLGGPGADTITGGTGLDNDHLFGQAGNDTLNGGAGNDVEQGGDGNDVVAGGVGNDALQGNAGIDKITGDSGDDSIVGGADADTIDGGYGNDHISGEGGDDDLTGGPGSDRVDGGDGHNICIVNSADVSTRCVYDLTPPAKVSVGVSPSAVDVTTASHTLSMAFHLSDDTGVVAVQIGAQAEDNSSSVGGGNATLVSGTARDGVWRLTTTVSRWTPPGPLTLNAFVRDRVGRTSTFSVPGLLTIVDATPDTVTPVVRSVALSPTGSVDVRTASRTVTITAHVTDAQSGVWRPPYLCLYHLYSGFWTNLPCADGLLVSGTAQDGYYRGSVTIPAGSVGGDWNVGVGVTDAAHPAATPQWVGPDVYSSWTAKGLDPNVHPLPDVNHLTVLGTGDVNPPAITSVTATPSSVDTLPAAATVTFSVHATDVEGVTNVGLDLHPAAGAGADQPSFPPMDLRLTAGTAKDGTWTGTLTLPQGTPPGTYALQVWVEDATHWRSYVSPESPYAGQTGQEVLPGPTTVVTVTDTSVTPAG